MTNTRKLAYIAILSAVSFLLLYFSFPLIPAADFLKVDFQSFLFLSPWLSLILRVLLVFSCFVHC